MLGVKPTLQTEYAISVRALSKSPGGMAFDAFGLYVCDSGPYGVVIVPLKADVNRVFSKRCGPRPHRCGPGLSEWFPAYSALWTWTT